MRCGNCNKTNPGNLVYPNVRPACKHALVDYCAECADCPACDGEGEVMLFTGPAPCPECNADKAPPPFRVPEGWKLVPIIPTEDMEVVGQEAVMSCYRRHLAIDDCEHARAAYDAMVDQAPEPPER